MEIDYDKIRNAGDHVMPEPFPNPDEMTEPGDEVPWLHQHSEDTLLVDRVGNQFLLMGFGPMQSACVLRDSYGQMFYADIGQRLKAVFSEAAFEAVTTQAEARDLAIEWQAWAFADDRPSLSYGELAEWQGRLEALASKFDLTEEFRENGII